QGDLSAAYDDAGNLTDLIVRRDGPCLPTGASCWQRLKYQWDEIGRLDGAQRWDLTSAERTANGTLALQPPARAADVQLSFAYGDDDERARKTAVDGNGNAVHTAYIFDSLELHRTTWQGSGATADYTLDSRTETVYLQAGPVAGRLFYAQQDVPS